MDGPGSGERSDKQTIQEVEFFKSAVDQFRFVTTMFWQQAAFFL